MVRAKRAQLLVYIYIYRQNFRWTDQVGLASCVSIFIHACTCRTRKHDIVAKLCHTSVMQGIKGASLSEKGFRMIRSITGGSGIGCM